MIHAIWQGIHPLVDILGVLALGCTLLVIVLVLADYFRGRPLVGEYPASRPITDDTTTTGIRYRTDKNGRTWVVRK